MMDKKQFGKDILPYVIAIVVFLLITVIYFSPMLEGKKLEQHDAAMWKGMAKEIMDYREATGEEVLWTNSMFGGMPSWQISTVYKGNLMRFVDNVVTLGLPSPLGFVFLYFLGFFILLLVLRVNPWVSMVGAIAFALSSYFFIIIGAGHISKAHAIGYMAPVLAGIILAFRGKYFSGALLTAISLALIIKSNHLQVTYYLFFLVIIYGIFRFVDAIQKKELNSFFRAAAYLIVGAMLAVLTHSTSLWATYDYGKDTIRGKPELTMDEDNKSSGLDRDYITAWSYGIGESWSLMIPNIKGGASGQIGNHEALKEADPNYRQTIRQQSAYWGDQPGTSGPVYVGVIIVFLFILGLFIVNTNLRWALLAATILSIMLAWGKNFMPLTDIFIDYVPGYNKFRAVSMILVIVELTMPLLAFLALDKLLKNPDVAFKKINVFNFVNINAFYIAMASTAGLILLFYITPTTFFSFLNDSEKTQFQRMMLEQDAGQVTLFMSSLEDVRIAIFRSDALRSLFFVVAAGILIIAFKYGKIKKGWVIAGIAVLVLVDMLPMDKRYLNNDDFVRARKADIPFTTSSADKQILQDQDPNFRVLDITKSTFNDSQCSYFHKSIGGYHGAKLQRYQDLIGYHIQPEIGLITSTLSTEGITLDKLTDMFSRLQVLGMLNTRYIMYNPDAPPLLNYSAFGPAWIVSDFKLVKNADEEIDAVGKNDLRQIAIVDERFSDQLNDIELLADNNATISMASYAPNHLVYKFKSHEDQVVVFSEIYYSKGWNAYIDGDEVPYFRANYVLRAMVVPGGEHTIEFKFEPRVWVIGEKISFASSLLLLLLMVGWIVMETKKFLNNKKAIE